MYNMNIYEQISAYVDQELDTYKALAMKIFAHPETSNHEYYACEQL